MATRRMKFWEKITVSGTLVLMLAVNSLTASACPDVHHTEEIAAEASEDQDTPEVILYDEQFVDEEGNITPANIYTPRVWCPGHDIIPGYFQSHVENDQGGCRVRTYYCTRCIVCHTIWLGDLHSTAIYAKCPH